jgi:hypothetical protein
MIRRPCEGTIEPLWAAQLIASLDQGVTEYLGVEAEDVLGL